MRLTKQILEKNDCYIVGAEMKVAGIMLHSTGANNLYCTDFTLEHGSMALWRVR